MMNKEYDVQETATLGLDATGKRWSALLIKAGWGSKGYYTEEALKRDGSSVFAAGTPIFLDHQTAEEREAKPFGSVQNFAGELATDAVWDEEQQGLVAEVEIFDHEQARVKSIAKRVGLSIRARTIADRGTMEGRTGRIITGLVGAKSVDLVVRAGAGGKFLDVLESDIDTEMEEQQMNEEVVEALGNLTARFDSIDSRLTEIEESLTAEAAIVEEVPAAVVTETTVDEVAPQFDAEKITELIAAEVAKLQAINTQESAELNGNEENADDVEESAVSSEIKQPRHWAVKGTN